MGKETRDVLFDDFLERALGAHPSTLHLAWLGGWEVAAALCVLDERFRANIHQIAALPYDPRHEAEADDAIEAFAFDLPGAAWADISAGAWRVLLERQQQAILLAAINGEQGNPLMPVPSGLPEGSRTAAAMLFLMYGMTLPFPVSDRSGLALPTGAAQASLRRH